MEAFSRTFRFSCLLLATLVFAAEGQESDDASVVSLEPGDLAEFEEQPPAIQKIIRAALALTEKKLTYRFGSNSPDLGGMDCSGTVQRSLLDAGLETVPRSSYAFYQWANRHETLHPTPDLFSVEDPRLEKLRPGDLLFWTGTYATRERQPPISHVMLYLGTLESDGRGVVVGASEGRSFRGERLNGVSVFDFRIPRKSAKSRFFGFARIPGLEGSE